MSAFSLFMSNSCNVHSPQARARLRGGGGGGDLTLNSLLRTWLSLKHPPSFRAFKQLECLFDGLECFFC